MDVDRNLIMDSENRNDLTCKQENVGMGQVNSIKVLSPNQINKRSLQDPQIANGCIKEEKMKKNSKLLEKLRKKLASVNAENVILTDQVDHANLNLRKCIVKLTEKRNTVLKFKQYKLVNKELNEQLKTFEDFENALSNTVQQYSGVIATLSNNVVKLEEKLKTSENMLTLEREEYKKKRSEWWDLEAVLRGEKSYLSAQLSKRN